MEVNILRDKLGGSAMIDSKEYISLEFNARWGYIQHIWNFIQNMLSEALNSKQAELIALSVSELVENSVKYSGRKIIDFNIIRILLEIHRSNRIVSIEVQNFSDKNHIKVLEKEVQRIKSKAPEQIYKEKLMEAATREDGGSQLGLVRIINEAKGRIETIVDDDKVAMRVEFDMMDDFPFKS